MRHIIQNLIISIMIFLPISVFAISDIYRLPSGDNWFYFNDTGYIYILSYIDSDLFREVALAIDFFKSAQINSIKVTINSPGGSFFDSIGIAQLLLSVRDKVRVETYGAGIIGSGATLIIIAGTPGYRFAYDDSVFMLHSTIMGRSESYATLVETIKDTERHKYIQNMMENIYLKQLKITNKELKLLLEKESWLDVQESLRIGLIDKVLK